MIQLLLAFATLSAALPGLALAQSKPEEGSNWGVAVSFSGTIKANKDFQKIFIIESDELLEASEFAIGLSRGKAHGGHWTVSYLSKPFKNKTITQTEEFSEGNSFNRSTTTTTFTDLRYKGIEALKYVAFATIKRRVQIGLNAGGGIAWVEGTVNEVRDDLSRFTQPNGQVNQQTQHEEETLPANEYLFKYQPLFKIEVQTAVIIAPGAKLTLAWGLNNPGVGFRIGGVYLFGAN